MPGATWSNPTPPSGPELTNVGFTGHEDDTELGLVNMGGRLYDPKLARFLQPDAVVQAPGFSQSWNPYGYVWHSPLRYTDPSGWQVEGGALEQGPPLEPRDVMISDAQAKAEAEPPDSTIVGPWASGTETTGPVPYGAQPQAAPAAPPSQPTWSMSDAQFYSIVTPGNNLNYDVHGVAIPPDPTATLLELGVLAAPFVVELAPVLAAAAPELFGALSELGAGLLEGVAPGSVPAYAGVGAGVAAAGERAASQVEGRGVGRVGGFLRSLSKGGGSGSIGKADRRFAERALTEFAERHTDELAQEGIRRWQVKSVERGSGLRDSDPELTARLGRGVSDEARRYYVTYQKPGGGTVQLSVNYDPGWNIFGTIKPSSGQP